MSKKELKIILQEILDEIDRIRRFTQGISALEEFVEKEVAFYAVLKCLENIGEAVKQIPEDKRLVKNKM